MKELFDEYETPLQMLKLANERLERDRQILARENEKLKETIRIQRLEIGKLKRNQQQKDEQCNKSLAKTQDMYAACALLAKENRRLDSERDAIDVRRRELLRRRIDDSRREYLMSQSISALSLKCEQHKAADKVAIAKSTEMERIISEQQRKIVKLEAENKTLKDKLITAKTECEHRTEELKRQERNSAKQQRSLSLKAKATEDSLNQTLWDLKKTQKAKSETEERAAATEKRCQDLGYSQQMYIQNIHECNEALRAEKRASSEKEKQIRQLKAEIDERQKTIAHQRDENKGYEQKMQRLLSARYEEAQKREKANNGNIKYEKLRLKYHEIEERNVMLTEENAFLLEHNKTLKSKLNAQSENRVNQLTAQLRRIMTENEELRQRIGNLSD